MDDITLIMRIQCMYMTLLHLDIDLPKQVRESLQSVFKILEDELETARKNIKNIKNLEMKTKNPIGDI